MTSSKSTGDKGEVLAVNYLRKKGFEILYVNWRYLHLELDIIAKKDNSLIVIEVKSGNSTNFGEPQEWVTCKKQQRIIKATNAFIEQNNIETTTRFDIIAVLFTPQGSQIQHIEDAFSAIG